MKRILDAHELMVFLEKEPGFEKIESLFTSAMEKDNYLLYYFGFMLIKTWYMLVSLVSRRWFVQAVLISA